MMQTKSLITKNNFDSLLKFINKRYPNAKCQLEYKTPWQLLLMTMLSARVTDNQVNKISKILFTKYKNVKELANANIKDVEKIIKPLGMYKIKSKNLIDISKYLLKNKIPQDREELLKLPGVGIKVANVILSEIYNKNYLAVDTHVKRILLRCKVINEKDNPLQTENKINKILNGKNYKLINHQLIEFGREICKSKNPKCELCPFKCSYKKL